MKLNAMPIPYELIFDVICDICGVTSEVRKDDFLYRMREDNIIFPVAYRFSGNLGLGGKFCIDSNEHKRWYVTNYLEDRNPKQEEIIKQANIKLEALRQYYVKINNLHKTQIFEIEKTK